MTTLDGIAVSATVKLSPAPPSATTTDDFETVTPGAIGVRQAENSDVFRFGAGAVAVAVITSPTPTPARSIENVASLPTVVTEAIPRKVRPSPCPEPSQAGTEKKSRAKVVLAGLLSVPLTRVVVPKLSAWVRTGKFCWLFGPPSPSFASFAVTPLSPRSIPSPPFWSIELPRIGVGGPTRTMTPGPPLNRITFPWPALVPPTTTRRSSPPTSTPAPPFGSAPVPAAFVPIALPNRRRSPCGMTGSCTTIPAPALPEMTFLAAGVVPPIVDSPRSTPVHRMPTPFGIAASPARFVPIRLPAMVIELSPSKELMPLKTSIPASVFAGDQVALSRVVRSVGISANQHAGAELVEDADRVRHGAGAGDVRPDPIGLDDRRVVDDTDEEHAEAGIAGDQIARARLPDSYVRGADSDPTPVGAGGCACRVRPNVVVEDRGAVAEKLTLMPTALLPATTLRSAGRFRRSSPRHR